MQQHPSIIAGPLLAFLLLFSCSFGEEILKEEIPPVQPEEKIAVSFSGRIDLVETKAGNEGAPETPGEAATTQALRKDVNVTIRAYMQPSISQPAVAPQSCRDPDGDKQNVNLSFTRLASRIKITVTSKGGTGSEEIIKADAPKITLPLTNPAGSKITLGANDPIGQYPVASDGLTLESTGNLTDGFTAGCILLPMQKGQKIPVRIVFPSITFNGLAAQTDKLYTADVTTPTGGFVSGKQYNYTVNITGNQVGVTGLSIEPWNVNDGQLPNGNITEDFD